MLTPLSSLALALTPDPCGGLLVDEALAGLEARADLGAARVIIVGEVHGYTAAPCMVEAIARRLMQDGRALAFGFEDHGGTDEQRAAMADAIAEGRSEDAMAVLLTTDTWSRRPFDGRQTVAWARLHRLAFDHIAGQPERLEWIWRDQEPREFGKRDAMTSNFMALIDRVAPSTVPIALVGNNWSGRQHHSVCTQLMERGIDPLCIEVHPRGQSDNCTWRIGTPAEIGLWTIRGWDDPVDLELHTSCDRRSPYAVESAD